MTAMVGEFPELQGIMGRRYAEAEGLPAGACARHRGALPAALCRRCTAYDQDRPGARAGRQARHAYRVFSPLSSGRPAPRILSPCAAPRSGCCASCSSAGWISTFMNCWRCAAAAQPVQRAGTAGEVYDFIAERLRGLLLERADGTSVEMIDAIQANRPGSPLDADARLQALKEFMRLPDAGVLTAINKRIANILKKAPPELDAAVQSGGLTRARRAGAAPHAQRTARQRRRFDRQARLCASLAGPDVDIGGGGRFFRIHHGDGRGSGAAPEPPRLLRDVRLLLVGVADLSRLPG